TDTRRFPFFRGSIFALSLVINLLKFKIMAVKFKVVKRKVLNGAEKDSVKNYAIAKTSGTSDLNKLCKLICSRSTLSYYLFPGLGPADYPQ
ncbi:hypothetical protein ABHZ63_26710, partial [Phocaeicola vulgatus]